MALAGELPPDASTASTGLGLRYLGTDPMFAYAFSGIKVATGGSRATLLEFISGTGLIVCEFAFTEDERGSNSITLEAYINEVLIINANYDASPQETRHVYPLLIPPFTKVKISFKADGTNIDGSAWLVGRVYDA